MAVALDSVGHVADRYGFSEEERRLARCNVQIQFALWIFEYAPMKSSELLAYANHHEGGWQSLPGRMPRWRPCVISAIMAF